MNDTEPIFAVSNPTVVRLLLTMCVGKALLMEGLAELIREAPNMNKQLLSYRQAGAYQTIILQAFNKFTKTFIQESLAWLTNIDIKDKSLQQKKDPLTNLLLTAVETLLPDPCEGVLTELRVEEGGSCVSALQAGLP